MGSYGRLVLAQIRSYTAYRGSFLIDACTNAIAPLMDLAALLAVFRVTRTLGGFAASEVLLMFGISCFAFALADLAVGEIEKLRIYIRNGSLDAVLVRPLPALAQLLTTGFAFRRAGRLVVATVVLVVAVARADLHLTAARVTLLVVAPLAGTVLFAAIFIAFATVAFWWIDSGEFASSFTYGGRDFTSYPVTVYGSVLRHVLSYGLGFAFVSYYPALALLGRPDPLGLPGFVAWSSPAVAAVAALLAAVVWRFGIRHYRSTGS